MIKISLNLKIVPRASDDGRLFSTMTFLTFPSASTVIDFSNIIAVKRDGHFFWFPHK